VGYGKLSIVVPVYNEESTVKQILRKLVEAKLPIEKEIIVVDDGSRDESGKLVKDFIAKHQHVSIKYYYKRNGGKGSALRLGFTKCTGDIITIQDADLEYDPSEYSKLLAPILSGQTQVVYGSRYLEKKGHFEKIHHATYLVHLVGNWGLSKIVSLVFATNITDMETCYKMFTREVLKRMKLRAKKFEIEPEITAKILKNGYKIREIRIAYKSRDFNEGKKITWRDGIKAFGYVLYYRFLN
jgi:glycosyltransferase involved in cell wall biosynthesis